MKNALPLLGKDILVTRGLHEGKRMAEDIKTYGGTVHHVPLLSFRYHQDKREHTYINELNSYEWIIFTSKNAVSFFVEILKNNNFQLEDVTAKVVVVGKKTKEYVEKHHISVSFFPNDFSAEGVVEAFLQRNITPAKILIPKGNLARDVIATSLEQKGFICDEWIIYETFLPEQSKVELAKIIKNDSIDVYTFTSSSTIHHFMKVVHDYQLEDRLMNKVVACIGPIAKRTAEEYNLHVNICPKVYTVHDMIHEIIQYYNEHSVEGK